MRRLLIGAGMMLAGAGAADAGAMSARGNYILHCSGCHGLGGLGTPEGGIPAFPGSVGHIAALDSGRTYIMHVPGVVSTNMTDAEVAAVMNYVLEAWGDAAAPPFTADEVTRRRAEIVPDVVEARRAVAAALTAAGVPIADYPWP